MQRKRFSRAAHAKLVFDLSAEFGKDAAWKLAAMDALRKADPYDLLLMHGLTTAEQLEFVEALIQKHLTSAAGLSEESGSGTGDDYIRRWREVMSPSNLDQATMQEGPHPMVRNWRPTSNFALPPELAFPAFGKFMDVLFEPPTRSDLESAAHHNLAQHIGLCFEKASVRPDRGRAQTDGVILIRDPDEVPAMHRLAALMEVKNDGGSGDSNFQGACYYGVFWGTRPGSPYKQNTCCPALLLEVAGPMLRVSALYWARTVVIRPLTSMMNLLWMEDNEAYMLSVAQVMAAIKAGVTELVAFYQQPPPALPPAMPPGVDLLPYPLLESNGRYSNAVPEPIGRADAHRAWAAAGLAPALYAFAGAVGAARYPPFLNTRSDSGSVSVELCSTRGSCGSSTQPDVAWPAGVEFNAPVLQEHDTVLLSSSIEQLWLRAASSSGGAPQPQPQMQLPHWLQQWQGAGTAASAAAAAAAGAPAADGSGVEAGDSGSAPSASRRGSRRSAVGDAGPAAAEGTGGRGRPRGRKGQQQQGGPAAGRDMGGRGRRGPKPPACFCVRATAAAAAPAVLARALARPLVARPLRAAVWL
eukprot:XP_001690029.1 predicted protein [Chlamydomonas reinhardtii]